EFEFSAASSYSVSLSGQGDGTVSADAIAFEPVSELPGAATVIDNTDAAVVVDGTWTTETSTGEAVGANYLQHASASSSTDKVTWPLQVGADGQFDVYLRWEADSTRATNAKYTVTHANGQTEVIVDQQQGGGDWYFAGTYDF